MNYLFFSHLVSLTHIYCEPKGGAKTHKTSRERPGDSPGRARTIRPSPDRSDTGSIPTRGHFLHVLRLLSLHPPVYHRTNTRPHRSLFTFIPIRAAGRGWPSAAMQPAACSAADASRLKLSCDSAFSI